MIRTDNLNIENILPLSSPEAVRKEYPLSSVAADTVVTGRADVENILAHRDKRHLMIIGPCSIHNHDGALKYAKQLRKLRDEVSDRILIIMRVYFEKPRTTLGWKGLIYDPRLDGTDDVEQGLRLARRIFLDIAEIGLPVATEILEPIVPQFITDLVSWASIGARTAESQTHRQLASGLSMPIGFKNSTDGSMKVAVEAIKTAMSSHSFIGITADGRIGNFRTRGNAYGHLVLRGGMSGPNYGSEYVAFARELMRKEELIPNIIVDCSHGNSRKQPMQQINVMRDVLEQLAASENCIIGTMLESYLKSGSQALSKNTAEVDPERSITDACLGWDETAAVVREAYNAIGKVRS